MPIAGSVTPVRGSLPVVVGSNAWSAGRIDIRVDVNLHRASHSHMSNPGIPPRSCTHDDTGFLVCLLKIDLIEPTSL